MSKRRERTPMGAALREARLDMRLSQAALASALDVSRATVNAWEVGKTVPPMEQRQSVLAAMKDAPPSTYERLARAFGFRVEAPAPPVAPAPPARDAAATRAAMTNAVRAAADDLDVAPSVVRRTIAAVLRRMNESALPVDELPSALVDEKRRG